MCSWQQIFVHIGRSMSWLKMVFKLSRLRFQAWWVEIVPAYDLLAYKFDCFAAVADFFDIYKIHRQYYWQVFELGLISTWVYRVLKLHTNDSLSTPLSSITAFWVKHSIRPTSGTTNHETQMKFIHQAHCRWERPEYGPSGSTCEGMFYDKMPKQMFAMDIE